MDGSSTGAGTDKRGLRSHFRRLRRASLAAAAPGLLETAVRELPARLGGGGRLGIWWPLAGEPDLLPLAERLPGRLGERLALPAVLPGGTLAYLPWRPGDPLVADGCGIPAPPADGPRARRPLAPEQLALLLVPALAVDRSGLRLGSGGGWYDRLRADPHWRRVQALAVLPAACVCPRLPRDPWDVPFDGWLDERGLHRPEPEGLDDENVAGS